MAVSTSQLKKLQREIRKLRAENLRLKRRLQKSNGRSKPNARRKELGSNRRQRLATIRQVARRNAMTEADAMALALEAQRAASH